MELRSLLCLWVWDMIVHHMHHCSLQRHKHYQITAYLSDCEFWGNQCHNDDELATTENTHFLFVYSWNFRVECGPRANDIAAQLQECSSVAAGWVAFSTYQ